MASPNSCSKVVLVDEQTDEHKGGRAVDEDGFEVVDETSEFEASVEQGLSMTMTAGGLSRQMVIPNLRTCLPTSHPQRVCFLRPKHTHTYIHGDNSRIGSINSTTTSPNWLTLGA